MRKIYSLKFKLNLFKQFLNIVCIINEKYIEYTIKSNNLTSFNIFMASLRGFENCSSINLYNYKHSFFQLQH